MNNENKVTPIKHPIYDLWGLELANGKKCCYWKNKSTNKIDEFIIILNNKNNVNIKNNQICISLEKITDLNDMLKMIEVISEKLKININNIKIHFIVDNEKEEQEINNLKNNSNLNIDIIKTEQYKISSEKKEELIQEITQNKGLNSDKTITAANGKQYTEIADGTKLVANLGILNNSEELKALYDEYMLNNPDIRQAYNNGLISNKEILEELQRQLIARKNLKTYDMDKATTNNKNQDNLSKIGNNYTTSVGGTINQEIGIIKDDQNRYQTIDNNGTIRTATVTQANYTDSGIENTTTTNNYISETNANENNNTFDYQEERQQQQEDITNESIYYKDHDEVIYNQEGKIIGKNGTNGYIVDENNNLLKDGRVIGTIGDINDMGKEQSNSQNKSYTRIYKKPTSYQTSQNNKSAAFVNLPIIIFIISLLLLIGSGIILFVMK